MPILDPESECFPPDLWTREVPLDTNGRWWCLHTKPRQEKAIARELTLREVTYYLPQVLHEGRTPRGRDRRALIPLFPSYLFLHGDETSKLAAQQTNRLVQALKVENQDELTNDLLQISKLLNSGLKILREPSFPVGSRIRILKGPLAGIEGVVVRRGQRQRFTAVVTYLRQGASVELDDWQVEPAEASNQHGHARTG
jgi:transcriptional antiterminator RfaH